ncbi:ion transporter [Bombiscardovia apis]|uniref:Ion transporter n=1 Tax=Bombiscardovia apis TaxID=2932182 RepID=A0ABN6SH96_9BIFI|nr:hemolysin family protein [Bombiscardovia apis]BDR54603.1 ion transporter [Bombiscardovia apis]
MGTQTILIAVSLSLATLLLIWLSLVMAAAESAVSRVTRSSLNNLILGLQTDNELSQFSRMKRIDKVHKVQSLIIDRHATTGSCAFFRVTSNIFTGVLVACLASLFDLPEWSDLVIGLVFAFIVAFVSVKIRPRVNGARKPLDIMLKHVKVVSFAVKLTPFARSSRSEMMAKSGRDSDLSDDEELEKLQIEQGRAMVDQLVEAGAFDPEISEMLDNVLTLSTTLTREIMVPRTDMICISDETTLSSALKLFSRSGFSRIPVIGDDVDDLKGVLYLKDVVRSIAFDPDSEGRVVAPLAREAVLVPESKPVDDLFHYMQKTRHHVAVVVDEYGGIAGMVTIEDAIEQIVGELEDEHDRIQHEQPQQVGEHEWKLPARTPIAELEELFEIDIDEDDVDTVYGLLTKLLGSVPIVGSSAVTRGLRLTAADAAGRRKKIATIIVEPASQYEAPEELAKEGARESA